MRHLFICMLLLIGTACSFEPLDRGEGNMFALRPVMEKAAVSKQQSIVVEYPTASSELDTPRIALVYPDGKFDYYSRTRWVDFLPLIVQKNLTETLTASGMYSSVKSDDSGLGDGLILKTHVRHFEAVYPAYTDRPPEARVVLDVRLENVKSGRPVNAFILRAAHQARTNTSAGIHEAFTAAFEDVQRQLMVQLK